MGYVVIFLFSQLKYTNIKSSRITTSAYLDGSNVKLKGFRRVIL